MSKSKSAWSDGVKHALRRLDALLQNEFLCMEAAGRIQDHPARGLFLESGYVRKLLNVEVRPRDPANISKDCPSLAALRELFSLNLLETDIILLATAAELDPRYESIFAYLHNDVTRKRPSVDLAARLIFGASSMTPDLFRCFHSEEALLRERLISLSSDFFPSRTIMTDSRIAVFLLGEQLLDERIAAWTTAAPASVRSSFLADDVAIWRRAFQRGATILLRGRAGSGKRTIAAAICAAEKCPLLVASPLEIHSDALRLLRREARLRSAAVYLALPQESSLRVVGKEFHGSGVTLFCGRHDRHDDDSVADYSFDVPALSDKVEISLWDSAINAQADGVDEVVRKFKLTPGQIVRAGSDAGRLAKLRGATRISTEDLHRAARHQSNPGLSRLASKVELSFGWEDIVLPAHLVAQLREICIHVRHRDKVYHDWGFSSRLGSSRGIAALFAGPSGTGKTMAAGVIARELGLELYRIDLASVVSKYIGDTERNLSRIFEEAEDSNAILFFDEADALFGKRSEVKDAHDRYANLEVAYLLQRMESYSGVAILATNLAANVDEAFARRLAHLVEFPFPDAALREKLWQKALPDLAPLDPAVNFPALAGLFQVSGGNIRNITLAAALAASEQGGPIGMERLIRATARELEKIGRQPSRAEFNEFYPLVEHRQ